MFLHPVNRQYITTILLVLLIIAAPALSRACVDYAAHDPVLASAAVGFEPGPIVLEGQWAYTTGYDAGAGTCELGIVITTNPANPYLYRSTPVANAGRLDVAGGYVYMACTWDGLKIRRASDLGYVADLDISAAARDVEVVGSYALVAGTYWGGLTVVSVSNPYSPSIVNVTDTPGNASYISISGSYAYLADGTAGVVVFDISNPASPVIITTIPPATVYGMNVLAVGNLLHVGGASDIVTFDVTNPAAPVELQRVPHNLPSISTPETMVADGDLMYVVGGGDLVVFDISTPSAPVLQGVVTTLGCGGVDVAGGAIVAGCGARGVVTMTSVGLMPPPVTGSVSFSQTPTGFCAGGELVSVALGDGGIAVADISNPNTPEIIATEVTPGPARDVWHGNGNVCVADGDSLQVFGLEPDGSLVHRSSFAAAYPAQELAGSGNLVYLLAAAIEFGSRISIIDVSEPATPVVVAEIDLPGMGATCFTLTGDLLFVVDWDQLKIFDVSDPASPIPVGSPLAIDTGYDIDAYGSLLCVVGGYPATAKLFDVANPEVPNLIGEIDAGDNIGGVTLVGQYAYLGAGSLVVADISVPSAPTLITSGSCNPRLWGTERHGDLLLGIGSDGLIVMEVQCGDVSAVAVPGDAIPATNGLELRAAPNPFNPRTSISFSGVGSGPVDLKVYDISGRLVRTLLVGGVFSDSHGQVVWDGTDSAGRPVAAGIYSCRLTAAGLSQTTTVVLVK